MILEGNDKEKKEDRSRFYFKLKIVGLLYSVFCFSCQQESLELKKGKHAASRQI